MCCLSPCFGVLYQRDNIIKNFRIGKIWMLICTDLMARGIDFKGVNFVLNFDFPQSVVSYIHRIGTMGVRQLCMNGASKERVERMREYDVHGHVHGHVCVCVCVCVCVSFVLLRAQVERVVRGASARPSPCTQRTMPSICVPLPM
jgi:hypothetical protein